MPKKNFSPAYCGPIVIRPPVRRPQADPYRRLGAQRPEDVAGEDVVEPAVEEAPRRNGQICD